MINPGVLYATTYYRWNMTNPNANANQRGTQMTDLSLMIGNCSIDSSNGGSSCHPANVGSPYFRYTSKNQINKTSKIDQRGKCTREDNKNTIDCYFKSNPKQGGKWIWMMDIWSESAKSHNSQRLTDQAKLILKEGWYSDLEKREKCVQVNREQYTQIVPPKWIETLNIENQTITERSTTTSILIQVDRKNKHLI